MMRKTLKSFKDAAHVLYGIDKNEQIERILNTTY
jgi:hypothetical protein